MGCRINEGKREKDFGMRLMRNDLWNDLRKRHKAYWHPAKVGCNTYERAFRKENVKGNFFRNWAYYNSKFILKKLVKDLLSLLTYGRRFATLSARKFTTDR